MDFLLLFLTFDFLGKAAWLWLVFLGVVARCSRSTWACCTRTTSEIGVSESLRSPPATSAVALLFGAWVWWYLGRAERASSTTPAS